MIRSDGLWKGLIISCLCILPPFYEVTDGRRYDKCVTQDGRQGVCVVKRYCREASNQLLLPCESDEENHCCPIPTTHRSAAAPRPWDEARPSEREQRPGTSDIHRDGLPVVPAESDHGSRRPAIAKESDRDRHSGIQRGHDSDDRFKVSDNNNGQVPKILDREGTRPEIHSGSGTGYVTRDQDKGYHQVSKSSDRENSRSEVYAVSEKDDRGREPDYDRQVPKRYDREGQRPAVTRGSDRDDRFRDPSRDNRRPEVPKDWEDRRPGVLREPERDDRLNKTPPPADRRSPTRIYSDRPKKPIDIDREDDPDEGTRRRPQLSQGYPKETPPADRHRDAETYNRPSTSRTDPPARRPNVDRFYPNREELDLHRSPEPPRRPKPDQRNDTDESSKAPIRFPDPYEFSVPRPRVPACGVKPYELFIAGGTESDQHEWPWMTAIFRRHLDSRPKTFLCGGSLINTKYVLTAAHCFVNNYVVLPASAFVVRLGSHFLNSGEEYTVANLVIHHNHSGSDFFNDIALVRLASEVYITDKIAPICLPPYPDMVQEDLVGRMATVAGWGDTSFRSAGSRTLQHVTVPIVSGEECFAAYSRVRGAAFLARGSDHVICAGLREGGKDACLGDSGGPLMMKLADDRWVVVGIVSLGYKCAEPGYPGVYTRVTHYMTWIRTNMKRH